MSPSSTQRWPVRLARLHRLQAAAAALEGAPAGAAVLAAAVGVPLLDFLLLEHPATSNAAIPRKTVILITGDLRIFGSRHRSVRSIPLRTPPPSRSNVPSIHPRFQFGRESNFAM